MQRELLRVLDVVDQWPQRSYSSGSNVATAERAQGGTVPGVRLAEHVEDVESVLVGRGLAIAQDYTVL